VMRLGVWKSKDGWNWQRQRTLRKSSANFDGSDIHSSSWGPFFLYDFTNDTWALSYVGYRGAPSNSSGWLENFDGTIFGQYAEVKGDAGLDSDFGDNGNWRNSDRTLVGPDNFHVNGPWPYQCQGMQGTDSFFPFQTSNKLWVAFLGTSFQELPDHRPDTGKWQVSLATAPSMFGPWTRHNPQNLSFPANAPCVDINGGYIENPIVSRRYDDPEKFHCVYDFLGKENLGFGYSCSSDGFAWSSAQLVEIPGGVRTPFGLVPLTAEEIEMYSDRILELNDRKRSELAFSLYWLFFTQNQPDGYEAFRAAIVQLTF